MYAEFHSKDSMCCKFESKVMICSNCNPIEGEDNIDASPCSQARRGQTQRHSIDLIPSSELSQH